MDRRWIGMAGVGLDPHAVGHRPSGAAVLGQALPTVEVSRPRLGHIRRPDLTRLANCSGCSADIHRPLRNAVVGDLVPRTKGRPLPARRASSELPAKRRHRPDASRVAVRSRATAARARARRSSTGSG